MKKLALYITLSLIAFGTASAVYAEERHHTLHHAIETLERTKAELENGEHGFGGHRTKAIEHIDGALRELHEALEYADAHPDEIKEHDKY